MLILMFLNVHTSVSMILLKIARGNLIHSVVSFTVRASRAVVKKKQVL